MELVSGCVECGLAEPESLASLGGSAPGVFDGILSHQHKCPQTGSTFPSQHVSMDHFKVTTKGCLYTSMGKIHDDLKFSGGCIFVDHTTGHVHVEHLVNFTTMETILAKHHYEKHMLDMGISILAYQSNNGIFATHGFLDEIDKGLQDIKFSGISAHHHTGIAERAIQTILMKACTIMIHEALHWPDMTDPSLWPMVVDYCVYHHNHCPCSATGILAPLDLLQKTKITCLTLQNMHVWGCPCYVLEPTLQDSHKLPKWQPHSHHAVLLGSLPVTLL